MINIDNLFRDNRQNELVCTKVSKVQKISIIMRIKKIKKINISKNS